MHKSLLVLMACIIHTACVPTAHRHVDLISGPYIAKHTIAPLLNLNLYGPTPWITHIVLHEKKQNMLNTFAMYDVPDDFSYTISADLYHHQKKLTRITLRTHIVLNQQDSVFISPKTLQMKRVMYQALAMRINTYAAIHKHRPSHKHDKSNRRTGHNLGQQYRNH